MVQGLLSSHGAAFGMLWHPTDGLQPSSVHGFPSPGHETGPRTHTSAMHEAVSHSLAGAQVVVVHEGYWQPVVALQAPPLAAMHSPEFAV